MWLLLLLLLAYWLRLLFRRMGLLVWWCRGRLVLLLLLLLLLLFRLLNTCERRWIIRVGRCRNRRDLGKSVLSRLSRLGSCGVVVAERWKEVAAKRVVVGGQLVLVLLLV